MVVGDVRRRGGQLGQDAHQPERHGDVGLAVVADLAERDVQEPGERRAMDHDPDAAVVVAQGGHGGSRIAARTGCARAGRCRSGRSWGR